jgi:hypothetical protein
MKYNSEAPLTTPIQPVAEEPLITKANGELGCPSGENVPFPTARDVNCGSVPPDDGPLGVPIIGAPVCV